MRFGWIAFVSGVVVFGVFCGISRQTASHSPAVAWQEIAWPFLRDAWPAGKAFRCVADECNKGDEVYVRPKIGFCNCTTGVDGDDEVDRVTDLDLISENFVPVQAGKETNFAGMAGRMRYYTIQLPDGTTRQATGFAVSHGCDVIVAVLQRMSPGLASRPEAQIEVSALTLLSSKEVADWLYSTLGGA
ncbi:MAG: hypothetical protein WBX25_12505 [Rhodomicrobium sp.]